MRGTVSCGWVAAAILLVFCDTSRGDLVDVLTDRRLGAARLGPALSDIGTPLADTVASAYPVASASSAVVYAFNEEKDTYEPQPEVAGPLFGERADTLGNGLVSVSVDYSYIRLRSIDGDDLDELGNRRSVDGTNLVARAKDSDAFVLNDGRQSNYIPVGVQLGLDLTGHVLSPTIVYGMTPHLDLGVTLPVVHTAFGVKLKTRLPDPRFAEFALCPVARCPTNPSPRDRRTASDEETGIGDLLLRAKYAFRRGGPIDVAAGLEIALPSGEPRNFHGLGATRVQPKLIFSRFVGDRVQPYANVGTDINTDTLGRSTVRWAVGTNVRATSALTIAVVFLGRHELERQAEVARPFFFQIHRTDFVDASLGFRYRFAESGSIAAGALLPLTSGGLRAEVIPTFEVAYAF